jgi:ABC-2 type transport system ATP-binding protein
MSYLRASKLRKVYGDHIAVDDLDLSVEQGEIFGLLGPNGAGKSTTIQMICGVVTPTAGEVSVGGLSLSKDAPALKATIGYVPQDLALYEQMSARENLRFFAAPYDIPRHERGARVDWALELAGLQSRSTEKIKDFSGGMKRRLNLVAGLIHKPKLLILDEPTVGVDPQSRIFLFEAIKRLRDEEGTTVLYTSHYLEEVEALCTRVAILDRGHVVACQPVKTLLASASSTLRIEVAGDPEASAALVPEGVSCTLDGQEISIAIEDCGAVLSALQAGGIHVCSVHSEKVDLERVFLSLTGRALRDEAQ